MEHDPHESVAESAQRTWAAVPCNLGRHRSLATQFAAPRHDAPYERPGLPRLTTHLHPGGVLALWSNDPPDSDLLDALSDVLAASDAQVVKFHNPLQKRDAASTVYVARTSTG